MKCFLIIPHEEEIDTPDGGSPTEWISVRNMVHFKSLTKALVYLQKNIREGDSRKRVNLKTLDDYRKKCKIFCFLSKWKKLVEKNMDIWEEKYRR